MMVVLSEDQLNQLVELFATIKESPHLPGADRNSKFLNNLIGRELDERKRIKPTKDCLKAVDQILGEDNGQEDHSG